MKIFVATILFLVWGSSVFAETSRDTVLGLYGVNPAIAPFKEMSSQRKALFLKELGANAIWGGYDDREFVQACKAEGLGVYASLGIFVGEKYWEERPESRPVDAEGKPYEKSDWYAGVCPTQQWLRDEKLRQIREKAESGTIDGLWLDFIRYPIHWEHCNPRPKTDDTCFCPSCLSKFREDTGIALPVNSATESAKILLGAESKRWHHWRCEQITDFVRDASEVLHEVNPRAKLGMFTVPWREEDYDSAVCRIVGQDFEALAPHVDVFSPMVYHAVCKEKTDWVHDVTQYMWEKTKKPVWPITQAFNKPYEIGPEEFEASIMSGLEPPSHGVILFSFNRIIEENRLEAIRRVFGKIGTDDE